RAGSIIPPSVATLRPLGMTTEWSSTKQNDRSIAMKKLVFLAWGCTALFSSLHSQTYDLGVDFTDGVVPSVGIGPDGVWSYGFDFSSDVNETNPIVFIPYTLHGPAPAGPDAYYTNGPA